VAQSGKADPEVETSRKMLGIFTWEHPFKHLSGLIEKLKRYHLGYKYVVVDA
jgi:hypothetical protein